MKALLHFARSYPWQSFVVLLCLAVAGLLEGLGLTALLPLLGTVTGEAPGESTTDLELRVREVFERVGLDPSFETMLVVVAIFFIGKAVTLLLAKREVGYAVARVATDLRLRLLRALLAARWGYFTRQPAGHAANAMASEAGRAAQSYYFLSQVLTGLVEAAAGLAVAIAVSWEVTSLALVAGAVSVLALNAFTRMAGRAGRKQTTVLRSLIGQLTDGLGVVKLLKATGRESLIGPLLAQDTERLHRALRRQVLAKEGLRALQEPILVGFACVGLYAGTTLAGMAKSTVLMLVIVFARTLSSMNTVQRKYQHLTVDQSALAAILGTISAAEEQAEPATGSVEPTLDRAISLRRVRHAYEGPPVFDDLSLEIPAGRITAIIGPSGAGKTTIVDLMAGLVQPEAGEVLIDGVSLKEIDLHRWRHSLGYVPQETLLFHSDVRTNVTLGDPELSDADVEWALREAGAWEFVASNPEGLDASVGERGNLLSGGQRQRIAIARALVHHPKLIVLDEATAALDPETEAAVWATVSKLRGKTTVVAISHQPALTGVADRIYRIENGRAVRVAAPSGPVAAQVVA
jgi:ATP-binding cassette subfamily C protein